ncbi:MAG TPA: hypothetical protein VK797_12595 [Tepidisphaeraceae bacterium]|jgi:hypothetical protein|nr:hypothetical protein [Tepidisphaeraceae bacterium]
MTDQTILLALEEQVGCYQRLAKLAQIQHEHIRQGRIEQLLDVLRSRQQVLEQMTACERIVAPAKRQWETFAGRLPHSMRQKAEALLAESRSLLEQITAADRDDALVLQQRKLNLGKELRQASSARQVNRMYGMAAYGRKPSTMDVQR